MTTRRQKRAAIAQRAPQRTNLRAVLAYGALFIGPTAVVLASQWAATHDGQGWATVGVALCLTAIAVATLALLLTPERYKND